MQGDRKAGGKDTEEEIKEKLINDRSQLFIIKLSFNY